ncbi:hypothetical protein J6590_002390 [Homalodisca vitripennis]|nr:hypothetical protein J6590_002390 [Homalodisca vitripennis]
MRVYQYCGSSPAFHYSRRQNIESVILWTALDCNINIESFVAGSKTRRALYLTERLFAQAFQRERKWQCDACDKSYYNSSDLRRHQRYQCGEKEPQFQCPQCPKRCRIKSNLQQHMLTHLKYTSA